MKQLKGKIHWKAVLTGAGIGFITLVLLAALGAALMANGSISVESMAYWSAGILIASGMIGALAVLAGRGGAVDCAVGALGQLVVLTGLGLALNDGTVEGIAATALPLAGGCGAVVLLSLGRGGRRKSRRRRKKS